MVHVEFSEVCEPRRDICAVHADAFRTREEADLVDRLLDDRRAAPLLCLSASAGGRFAAHLLCTRVDVTSGVPAMILAPLAVVTAQQGRGIGTRLVREAVDRLKERQVQLLFVLGDPGYYSRFGFVPALDLGFLPPQKLPAAYREAWQVLSPAGADMSGFSGAVSCSSELGRELYWQ